MVSRVRHHSRGEGGTAANGHPASLGERRVAALTGLRGVVAASVVLFHVWSYAAPGAGEAPVGPLHSSFEALDVGVTFFFVLSGFLLFRSYAKALLTDAPWPSLRNFAISRVLRIVPAYWLILLIVTVLMERRLLEQPARLLGNAFFLEFWFPSWYPENLHAGNGSVAIVPSWSLPVEAGFYLTLPVVAYLALWYLRRTGRRLVALFLPAACLTAIGVGSIVVEHVLTGGPARAWYFGFPVRAGFFAFGMAGTGLLMLAQQRGLAPSARAKLLVVLASLGVVAGSVKLRFRGELSAIDYHWPVAVAFTVLLVVLLVGHDRGPVHRLLGSPVVVASGLASYSIFLVHDPILRALRDNGLTLGGTGGFLVNLCVIGAATAAATCLSYQVVEKRCFALKRRLTAGRGTQPVPVPVPGPMPQAAALETPVAP